MQNATPTAVGCIALLFWSVSTCVFCLISHFPIFEFQFLAFLTSFLVIFTFHRAALWHAFKNTPWPMIIAGLMGSHGQSICFLSAIRFAPPEQVELIVYLWPIMLILGAAISFKERLQSHHLCGGILSFLGLYVLFGFNQTIQIDYWKGYGFALLTAGLWTFFTLMSKKYDKTPKMAIGIYYGLAAVISLILHLRFEEFIIPTGPESGIILYTGITSYGLAYFFWDYGVKKGNYHLLCVLSYFNPILSIALLIAVGLSRFTLSLLFASVLICIGAYLASEKHQANRPWLSDWMRGFHEPSEIRLKEIQESMMI